MNERGENFVGFAWQPADQIDELVPLLRGGQLSRYRLLDIACPNDHRLGQILHTPRGPLFIGRRAKVEFDVIQWEAEGDGGELEVAHVGHRSDVYGAFIADCYELAEHRAQQEELGTAAVDVQCRCRSTYIPILWLRDQLDAHRRRVVWP